MAYDDRSRPGPRLHPRYVALVELTGRLSAIAVIAIGATVLLVGWLIGVDAVRSLFHDDVTMKANTAAGVTACGISLLLLSRPGRVPRLARVPAAAAAALGAVTLIEHATGWKLGIDQALFHDDRAAPAEAPGRMSLQVATSFLLAGIALLGLDWRLRGVRPAGVMAWVVGAVATAMLLSQVYDITSLHMIEPFAGVAPQTAVAFLLLAIGIGCARPRDGLTAVLAADSPAGVTIRSLLPPAIVVPPIVGTLVLAGQRHGLLGDGEAIWLLVMATVIGCVTFGVATAISLQKADGRRRKAEIRLNEHDRMFRTMVEQMPLIVYVDALDEMNTPLYMSPQVEQTLGYTADEWVADLTLFERLLHGDDRERVLDGIKRFRESGHPFRDEYRLRAKDGRWVWVQDATVQALDYFGRPLYAQGYMLDITARKATDEERRDLEAQLGHAQKLDSIGQLAGGVAHDFNNLLGAIIAYADFAEGKARTHPEILADVAQIRRAAERGADLTNQLLVFSRKDVVRPRGIDLVQTVLDNRPLMHPLLGDDVTLHMSLSEEECRVEADPTQIQRILLNLGLNARAAMRGGGTIEVAVEQVALDALSTPAEMMPGPHVSLTVSDTGCGMPAEVADRAFEPFFTTKPTGEGTGLGLATVYGIVKRLRGHVELDTKPGAGTTVKLLLPFFHDAGRGEDASPQADDRDRLVLVVDDDDALRTTTSRMLSENGYGVLEAGDGADALRKFRTAEPRPALLLTDVIMPKMTGTELATAVRAIEPHARVVYMSGFAQDLADEGPDAPLIGKPFSSDALLEAVSEALADACPIASGRSR